MLYNVILILDLQFKKAKKVKYALFWKLCLRSIKVKVIVQFLIFFLVFRLSIDISKFNMITTSRCYLLTLGCRQLWNKFTFQYSSVHFWHMCEQKIPRSERNITYVRVLLTIVQNEVHQYFHSCSRCFPVFFSSHWKKR